VPSSLRATIRNLLPRAVARLIRDSRNLDSRARFTYFRLQLRRFLGLRRPGTHLLLPAIHSVLFVCHGNIMRSPLAAGLLRMYLCDSTRQRTSIGSAGLHAQPGRPADDRAISVAREFGVDLGGHQTQLLTAELAAQADLILVMDYQNEAELLARFPQFKGKIALLGDYRDPESATECEIEDPYTGDLDGVQRSFRMIQSCARRLALLLNSNTACRSDLTGEAGPK